MGMALANTNGHGSKMRGQIKIMVSKDFHIKTGNLLIYCEQT